MAMSPSWLGDDNKTAGAFDTTLFRTIFTGEVLTAFEQSTVMMGRHQVRTISSGKAADFAVMGRTTATKHTPGSQITGKVIAHNTKSISIDGLLISDAFLANLDEAMNHYDVRAPYSTEMGRALALAFDRNVIIEGLKGSQATHLLDSEITAAGSITDGNLDDSTLATRVGAVVQACFTAGNTFDKKNVPDEGRFLICGPLTYAEIVQNTDAINKDWGGAGSYADGKVTRVNNIEIVKAKNAGFAVYGTSGTNYNSGDHQYDLSAVWGFFGTPNSIGTVKLIDVQTEMDYLIDYQGTLIVSKMAVGHSWLRPEACIELQES